MDQWISCFSEECELLPAPGQERRLKKTPKFHEQNNDSLDEPDTRSSRRGQQRGAQQLQEKDNQPGLPVASSAA